MAAVLFLAPVGACSEKPEASSKEIEIEISPKPMNFVCFKLRTHDWAEIGDFETLFYPSNVDGKSEALDGVEGFHLSFNPALLSITLGPDVVARDWIFALPREIQRNAAVETIQTQSTDCVADDGA